MPTTSIFIKKIRKIEYVKALHWNKLESVLICINSMAVDESVQGS